MVAVTRGALEDHVLTLVRDLSGRHGWSWATEAGFRAELQRRSGRRIGERSFLRALDRLAERGVIEHVRIYPGQRMANGQRTSFGTTHNRIVARAERRRKAKQRAREAKLRSLADAKRLREAEAERERQRIAAEKRAEEHAAEERAVREAASPDDVATFMRGIGAILGGTGKPPPPREGC